MKKLISFDQYFENTHEPTFTKLVVGQKLSSMEKTAAAMSSAYSYAETMEPKEGSTYILVIAMGAGEFYGCFCAGAPVEMADGSTKPIEHVEEGELVVTHTGAIAPVTKTMNKTYNGNHHAIGVTGYHQDMLCTEEHPLYTARAEDVAPLRRKWYKRKLGYTEYTASIPMDFHRASEVVPGDYVAMKFETEERVTDELGNNDMAYLLGMHTANGCLAKRYAVTRSDHGKYYRAVIVVNGETDEEAEKLKTIVEKLSGNVCRVIKKYRGHNAHRLEFIWTNFAELVQRHVGLGAHGKSLSKSLLSMPKEWLQHFLSGYLNGDGHQVTTGKSRYHGALTCSSVSTELVTDILKIAFKLGYRASSHKFMQHHTALSAGNTIYEVSFEKGITAVLPRTRFVVHEKTQSAVTTILDTTRGYALFPVKCNTPEVIVDTTVYNLEVEGDNSYVAYGLAVHNCNKNGDYFPEHDLKLQYKNFETIIKPNPKTGKDEIMDGALLFKHHKNKVKKNHPWFGLVHKAFYNERMHRVELIIEVIHSQPGADDLVEKIETGGNFAVSMGVNIPFDRCSICGNEASKVSDYCVHLKTMLKKIMPDGRQVYAINGGYDYEKKPKALNFFDISYVFRPADKTGFMLKKVASEGFELEDQDVMGSAVAYEKLAALHEKSASLQKMSEITKYFEGQPVAATTDNAQLKAIARNPEVFKKVVSQMKPVSSEHVSKLSGFPMKDILTTLSSKGIILTTPEFIQLIVKKKTGLSLSLSDLEQVAKDQASYFDELADDPDTVEKLAAEMDMFSQGAYNQEIFDKVADIAESRDLTSEGFFKKASTSLDRSVLDLYSNGQPWGDGKGMHHTEDVIDPVTGRPASFSMAALEDGQAERNIIDTAKVVGGAGLLGGTYLYLNSLKSAWAPAAGFGALALGAKGLYNTLKRSKSNDYYESNQGTLIPKETHLIEKTSSLFGGGKSSQPPGIMGGVSDAFTKHAPGARLGATFAPMALSVIGRQYYKDRINSGTAGTYRTNTEKYLDNAGRIAYEHPYLTAGAGMVAGHGGLNLLSVARKAILGR